MRCDNALHDQTFFARKLRADVQTDQSIMQELAANILIKISIVKICHDRKAGLICMYIDQLTTTEHIFGKL